MAWFDSMLRENAQRNIIYEADRLEQKMYEEKVNREMSEYFASQKKNISDGSGWCENCNCNECMKNKIVTVHAYNRENII